MSVQFTISELDTQFEHRDTYMTMKTMMEYQVGWWEEDSLELYFKGTNTKFDFQFYIHAREYIEA
jgi:hypothetical protein